jgi:hypothetical protein
MAALAWPRAPLQAAAQRLQQGDGNTQTASHIEALAMAGKFPFKPGTT